MITYFENRHNSLFYKILSAFIAFTFSFTSVVPPSCAQSIASLNFPLPGTMVAPSAAFVPVLLKGMTIHPDDPLKFDFIIDSGNTDFDETRIKDESQRLVKYFLASMTIPKDDLWVNLSPYESDKIIPEELGKTELGRDMLAQDYILKQLTASLMYPEKELGKEFWNKVYQKAQEKYGTTEIPVNTFNKVWILPETATVYEHGQTVYIVDAKLKVMLDSDYEAMQQTSKAEDGKWKGENRFSVKHQSSNVDFQSSIIREVILPAIEKEVNEGQNFAPLRQIYHSLILAKWYKETIKESLLSKVYVDQKKIAGVNLDDATLKDQIYAQYMEAYKKGVFNYIKEDYDRLCNETIPRKYFSGGIKGDVKIDRTASRNGIQGSAVGENYKLALGVAPQKKGENDLGTLAAEQENYVRYRTVRDIQDALNKGRVNFDIVKFIHNKITSSRVVTMVDVGHGFGVMLNELGFAFGDRFRGYGVDSVDWKSDPNYIRRALEELKKGYDKEVWVKNELEQRYLELLAAQNFTFIQQDMGKVKLPEKADLITSFYALQYHNDPLGVWSHLFNQLASGGILIVQLTLPINEDGIVAFYKDFMDKLRVNNIDAELQDYVVPQWGWHFIFLKAQRKGSEKITLDIGDVEATDKFMLEDSGKFKIKVIKYKEVKVLVEKNGQKARFTITSSPLTPQEARAMIKGKLAPGHHHLINDTHVQLAMAYEGDFEAVYHAGPPERIEIIRGGKLDQSSSPISFKEARAVVATRLEAIYPGHAEYRNFINKEFVQQAAQAYGRSDVLDIQRVIDLRIQAAVTRGHGKKVIMFVAEEGWAKKGGQGDYIRELGEALAAQGHMVLIVNPYFQKKNEKSDISPADGQGLVTSEIPIGAGALPMTTFYNNFEGLHYLRFRGSEQEIQALLYPEVYPDEKKDSVYYSDSLYGYVESILLSKAAMHIDKALGLELDVLHFNDWQAALGPVYLELYYRQNADYRPFLQNTGTVVIAHNLAYQGSKFNGEIQISKDDPLLHMLRSRAILGEDRVRFLGETAIVTLYDVQRDYHDPHASDKILINLPPEVLSDSDRGLEFWSNKVAGRHNFLKGGIIFANLVTAVSKGNMEEIQGSDQFGFGLEGILAEKAREGGLGYVYNGLSFKKNKPEYLSVLNEEVEGERFTKFSENDPDDVFAKRKLQNKMALVKKIGMMKASADGDFSKLLKDKALFSDLVENGYLDAKGEIQNKFRLLRSESKLVVNENYIPQKKNIYKVLKNKDEIHGELGTQGIENDLVEAIVSRLVSQKGYDILFEKIDEAGKTLIEKILSLRGAKGEKIRLVIMASAGDDAGLKSAEKLRELVNKDPYMGQIVFLEMFDPKLAQQVLAGADSFFMPSAYEPGGISNLQAAMNGLLTILTLTGGLKDFVEMGGTLEKFAVAPFNSNNEQSMGRAAEDFAVVFAEALTLFGEHREQWIAAAKQAMRIEADWSDKVDSYISLYNDAMAKAQSSSPASSSVSEERVPTAARLVGMEAKSQEPRTDDDEVGGIDMNTIDLERLPAGRQGQGGGVDVQFDPAQLQDIIDVGIDGFAPVIINIAPLPSVLPLLGLEPANKEESMEVSAL